MKSLQNLTTVKEAADHLKISKELVQKFIDSGIILPAIKKPDLKLNGYNFRRLILAIELHEQCIPLNIIEDKLNN